MKKAFLIRGFRFGYTAADSDYVHIRDLIHEAGYEPVPVPWMWNYKTMSQYSSEFVKFFSKNKGSYNIVIGHSFGAACAFVSAGRCLPDQLVLCSLSAYFQEDLPKYDKSDWIYSHMGKKRLEDFKSLSAKKIAKEIATRNISTKIMCGELEKQVFPHLYERVLETSKDLDTEPILIQGVDHTIHLPRYMEEIKKALK
jgi:hypothetical protein